MNIVIITITITKNEKFSFDEFILRGGKTKRSVIVESKGHCSGEQLEFTTQARDDPNRCFLVFPRETMVKPSGQAFKYRRRKRDPVSHFDELKDEREADNKKNTDDRISDKGRKNTSFFKPILDFLNSSSVAASGWGTL